MTYQKLLSACCLLLLLAACKKDKKIHSASDFPVEMKVVNQNSKTLNVYVYQSDLDYAAAKNELFYKKMASGETATLQVIPSHRYYFDIYDDDLNTDNWKSSNYITNREGARASIMFLPYDEGKGDNTYVIPDGTYELASLGFRKHYVNGKIGRTNWRVVAKQEKWGTDWGYSMWPMNDSEKYMAATITRDFKISVSSIDASGVFNINTEKKGTDGQYYGVISSFDKFEMGSIDFRRPGGGGYMTDSCFLNWGKKRQEVRYVLERK